MSETLSLNEVRAILHERDDSKVGIVQRMRALFDARHHNSDEAIDVLTGGLFHHSVLLRHEICYVMGQMSCEKALPVLIRLLDDVDEHPMVRHEAGEAIAALGIPSAEAMDVLKRNCLSPSIPVRETCELALIGLQRRQAAAGASPSTSGPKDAKRQGFYIFTETGRRNSFNGEDDHLNKSSFSTHDPAPGDKKLENLENIANLRQVLMDEQKPLWDRYVAMFTLRNISSRESASALADALDDKSSALLRHEICFVLGQLQLAVSLPKLVERLEDLDEHQMVRHEAALALGSVGADNYSDIGRKARQMAIEILQKYSTDPDPVVWESCLTGLANIQDETGSLEI